MELHYLTIRKIKWERAEAKRKLEELKISVRELLERIASDQAAAKEERRRVEAELAVSRARQLPRYDIPKRKGRYAWSSDLGCSICVVRWPYRFQWGWVVKRRRQRSMMSGKERCRLRSALAVLNTVGTTDMQSISSTTSVLVRNSWNLSLHLLDKGFLLSQGECLKLSSSTDKEWMPS